MFLQDQIESHVLLTMDLFSPGVTVFGGFHVCYGIRTVGIIEQVSTTGRHLERISGHLSILQRSLE